MPHAADRVLYDADTSFAEDGEPSRAIAPFFTPWPAHARPLAARVRSGALQATKGG
jgi:hypothetical protein